MNKKDIIILSAIISSILIIGSILIATESLPEQKARDFNPLANMTIKHDMMIVDHELFDDNVFSYAINDVAKDTIYIALEDDRVKSILEDYKGLDITIAGIQPVVMIDADNNELHNSIGEVIITVNWEESNGKLIDRAYRFDDLDEIKANQIVWTIIVDLDDRMVIDMVEKNRVIEKIIKPNIIYMDVNVYLPREVIIDEGSIIEWINTSQLPHNIQGIYKTYDGDEITIDSGFLDYNERWRYEFDKKGVFEYHCSIHMEDGMEGIIIIR